MKWIYFLIGIGFTITILYLIGSNTQLLEKMEQTVEKDRERRIKEAEQKTLLLCEMVDLAVAVLMADTNIYKQYIDQQIIATDKFFVERPKETTDWLQALANQAKLNIAAKHKKG